MTWLDAVRSQSKPLAELAVQHSTVATFVLDTHHRVICWNKACESLTGVGAVAVIGSDEHWKAFYREKRPCLADELIDGNFESLKNLYSVVSKPRQTDHGWHVESWVEHVGGKRRYMIISAAPIYGDDGKLLGAIESLQDVTDMKKSCDAERTRDGRMHQQQKMEAISRLAGGIAHDFNNLLTAILGYTRLLKENLGEVNPLQADIEEIIRAGEKGSRLTKQLLAISRKQVMQPEALNVAGVLADTLPMLRQRAGQKIQIHSDCDPNPWNVKADVGLLEQMLVQLVVNGRDAMPNGGKIHIRIANMTLDESFCRDRDELSPGKYVVLMVSDNGIGMSANVREHLFEPFFTTKDEGSGAGLGLSMVYGIVRQMEGYIDVETSEEIGTRFSLYFPVVEQEASARMARVKEPEAPTGTETVLVVEDEDIVRHLVVLMLKSLGYRVLEASDGREALTIAKRYEGSLDLVLTDVVMPHVGGLELVKRLRPIRRDFRVLYTSGFTDGRLLDHGLLDGDYNMLLKPYTRESLARKVREALDKS